MLNSEHLTHIVHKNCWAPDMIESNTIIVQMTLLKLEKKKNRDKTKSHDAINITIVTDLHSALPKPMWTQDCLFH